MRVVTTLLALLLCGCATTPADRDDAVFWSALQSLCGKAYEGRMTEGTEPSDAALGQARLVMHVRSCSDTEIRIPFHVGENRSRTWVITRLPAGFRLKHDHRHEDGTPDRVTQYGGDTRDEGEGHATREFFADEHTAALVPAARTNIWTIAVDPGTAFTYALRREESGRRFRVDFDLTKRVPPPPPPW